MPRIAYPSKAFLVVRHGIPAICGGLAEGAVLSYLIFRLEGGLAHRSIPDIQMAEYTGVPPRSVRRCRERLISAGLITISPRPGFGYVYAVQVEAVQVALDVWAQGVPDAVLGH